MTIRRFICGIILANFMILCIGNKVSAEVIIKVNPLKILKNRPHRIDTFGISDVNGDGERELILIEHPYTYPMMPNLTISRIIDADKRELIWETEKLWNFHRLIVGDLDSDGTDEVIVYGSRPSNYTEEEKTLRIIDWNGSSFEQHDFIQSGNLGLIADVNNDGKNELVLGNSIVSKGEGEGEGTEPMDISIYSWTGKVFNLIETLSIPYGARRIAAGDINNDGITEIITQETPNDVTIKSQVSIYQYNSKNKKIERIFSKSNFSRGDEDNKELLFLAGHRTLVIDNKEYLLLHFGASQDDKFESKVYSLKMGKDNSYSLILEDELSKKIGVVFDKLVEFQMIDIDDDGKKDIIVKQGLTLKRIPFDIHNEEH